MTSCISQLSFSFYRHRSIQVGIFVVARSPAMPACCLCGLFDQRHGLTRGLAECVCDDRDDSRVSHLDKRFASASTRSSLATRMPTTRIAYVTIRRFRFLPTQPAAQLLDHNQQLVVGRTRPRRAISLKLQDALLDWFVQICGEQVRKRGEILLDVDSTDDPTYGQQQLSFFIAAFATSTCITLCWSLSGTPVACWPPDCGRARSLVTPASSPCCCASSRDSSESFPRSASDCVLTPGSLCRCSMNSASFSASSTPSASLPTHGCKRKRSGCSVVSPDVIVEAASRSDPFPAFSIALTAGLISGASASKAEHTESGTNVRFLVTNLKGRSRSTSLCDDRGECENRLEEFKNGFAADRLSCHRFRANVPPVATQFRLQSRQPVSFATTVVDALRTNRNAAHSAVQDWCAHPRNRSLHPHSPGQRLALSGSLPSRVQLLLDCLARSTTHSRKGHAELSQKNGS